MRFLDQNIGNIVVLIALVTKTKTVQGEGLERQITCDLQLDIYLYLFLSVIWGKQMKIVLKWKSSEFQHLSEEN